MKIKSILLLISCNCFSLFGMVENSVIPDMNELLTKDLNKKVNSRQMNAFASIHPIRNARLRLMSYNMLLDWSEQHLEPIDKWKTRKYRMAEYLRFANPDIIGTQELRASQLEDVIAFLGDRYDYYGVGAQDGQKQGDIAAVFYRRDRIELVEGKTFYFSETPEQISESPFGAKNTFSYCLFNDKLTDQQFIVLNMHFAFANIERRYYEACKLRDFLIEKRIQLPILITGDFNTFPFRQKLELPFYDGNMIVNTIEEAPVRDSQTRALFGHFGPISTTNFNDKTKKPFSSTGTPGVILDHIFINDRVHVLAHGIDPAVVDGRFPSDHFPVIVDFLIPYIYQQFMEDSPSK